MGAREEDEEVTDSPNEWVAGTSASTSRRAAGPGMNGLFLTTRGPPVPPRVIGFRP